MESQFDSIALRKRTKIADSSDLVKLAIAAQSAVNFVDNQTNIRLREVTQQMLALKDRAIQILEEAARDACLHKAACNMVKRPGTTYYFYEKKSPETDVGEISHQLTTASIISPDEWGSGYPFARFLGAYQLQMDQTWRPVGQDYSIRDSEIDAMVRRIKDQPSLLNALTAETRE